MTLVNESSFIFDVVLDAKDICNLEREKKLIQKGIHNKQKIVVYGPRNYGKTSLIKSVIIPEFKKKHPKSFVMFADLMEVKSLDSLLNRIQNNFESSFRDSFSGKYLMNSAKQMLSRLRPQIEFDPLTSQPVLSLNLQNKSQSTSILQIFETIQKRILPSHPTLIVFDEFQDIAFIPEAQGLMRQALQELKNVSIILMGSKQHLLSKLFAEPNAPFSGFGQDIEFKPIPYEEYHAYISDRFEHKKLRITLEDCTAMQELLFRVPEPINMVCASLLEKHWNTRITTQQIVEAIEDILSKRQSRYEAYLSHFSDKEENVLVALANSGHTIQPTGMDFLKKTKVSARSASLMIKKFMDHSVVNKTKLGFRIADPLLYYYLLKFR